MKITDEEFNILWDMMKFIASEYPHCGYVRYENSYKKEFLDKLQEQNGGSHE